MKPACRILYQDTDHSVVLKPAGMATHGRGKNTLLNHIQNGSKSCSPGHWKPLHRLDYGTRGPVVFAHTMLAYQALRRDWSRSTKIYHAWHVGQWKTDRGLVAMPLKGKHSETRFRCLGSRSWGVHGVASLVEWAPLSGRTHQIRRHAAAVGHPIVGDTVYGTPPVYRGYGLHLTCTYFSWIHPMTDESMEVTVPPAKKMRRAVQNTFMPRTTSPWMALFESA